ncbi:hypothetical protein N7478_000714 [Penicillium angulare]|uniref:uncharacterized protein n=1 Tax=Penicillium angulare TaxID=116970 RepID=UPI0025413872|nr:uncharacterized protein N7478_000714 [Penicillium angulare]KAJ5291463.1 hypothetical protein N7478_000714 [Penicillium angulare]
MIQETLEVSDRVLMAFSWYLNLPIESGKSKAEYQSPLFLHPPVPAQPSWQMSDSAIELVALSTSQCMTHSSSN